MMPRLVEERVWERREEIFGAQSGSTTPGADRGEAGRRVRGPRSSRISRRDLRQGHGERRLPDRPDVRVEVRRLRAIGSQEIFFDEVSGPSPPSRITADHARRNMRGSRTPSAIRAARANIRYHLAYVGWLAPAATWCGRAVSYAICGAVRHLSVRD